MNKSDKRAEVIKEIMKYKEYSDGVMLQDLYRSIKNHPQFNEVFGDANINNPKQYQNSTRALLQHRAPLSSQYKHKSKDFLNIGNKTGRWTYFSNSKFNDFIKVSEDLCSKLAGIDDLKLNTAEKTALIKVRLNQTSFRKMLIKEMKTTIGSSPIKRIDREDLLIASHIVDYAHCDSPEEQANYFNGLILSPDIDKLFDKKLISFDQDGKIITRKIDTKTLSKMGVTESTRLPREILTMARIDFLEKRNILYKFKNK